MQTMQVNSVIPGFAEGLQLLPRGGVYRFCIPAAQGYGITHPAISQCRSDLRLNWSIPRRSPKSRRSARRRRPRKLPAAPTPATAAAKAMSRRP
jgi:FKBP-type peptidyl-prolyl cis-trans isomerase FkpA